MLETARHVTMSTYSFLRTSPPIWSLLNRVGDALYRRHPPRLNEFQQKVAQGLIDNGIALAHLDELLPDADLVSEMKNYVKQHQQDAEVGARKTFLQYFWTDPSRDLPVIDVNSPFGRFSLGPAVLDIVNAYLGTCSKLIHFDLAATHVMPLGAKPMKSQRWHRDPGLKRIVKTFLYLSDVDEASGPFTYVLASHAGGRWGGLFPQPQFGRHGLYPAEGAVDQTVPAYDIKACTGRAGTVIFCDTTGLHKGGYSVSKSRVMYTSVYVAAGDVQKPLFRRPRDIEAHTSTLTAAARFAIT